MPEGIVVSLYIAGAPHAPMTAITEAHMVPGRGIEGDRFYARRGVDTVYDGTTFDVTLVEEPALEKLGNGEQQADFAASARRNIVLRGCSLHELIGQTFRIGEVTLHGYTPHGDCSSEQPQQATACDMVYGANMGAHILTEGVIHVGDRMCLPP